MPSTKSQPAKKNVFYFSVVLVFLLLSRLLFSVRQLNCQLEPEQGGIESVCQFLEAKFSGRSLFFYRFENDAVWDELLEKSDYSQVYQLESYTKTLPSKLNLKLLASLPDYRLQYLDEEGQEQKFLINQNNKLKNDHPDLDILTIVYLGEEEIVDEAQLFLNESAHQKFLALARAIEQFDIPAEDLVWQNDSLLKLNIGKSWLVLLDSETNFSKAMQALGFLLKDEESLEKVHGHQYLDLRFRLPVLRDQL